MTLRAKIYLAALAALLVGLAFVMVDRYASRLVRNHSDLLSHLGDLERLETKQETEVLRASFFLYHDYDPLHRIQKEIAGLTNEILGHRILRSHDYTSIVALLSEYRVKMEKKREYIERFETLNSVIKNSASYIASLSHRYLLQFGGEGDDREYLVDVSLVTAAVSLVRSSLDKDMLIEVNRLLPKLSEYQPSSSERARFNRVFTNHAKVLVGYFDEYGDTFDQIMDIGSGPLLSDARSGFVDVSERQSRTIRAILVVLAIGFVVSIVVIIYFLARTERENKALLHLQRKLEHAANTDALTGLGSRFRFERELASMDDPSLLLVNIAGFKEINDFYGTAAGDMVLSRLAEWLESAVPDRESHRTYRIGADHFACLTESAGSDDLRALAARWIRMLENAELTFLGNPIPVRLTIAASRSKPVLETADMALRVLKSSRSWYLEYDPGAELHRSIERNLAMLNLLRHAIASDRVVPYFQPIFDLRSGKVAKYECLIRVRSESGEVVPPGQFLDIARNTPIYGELTRAMIAKCTRRFADEPYDFAVNLSPEDIMDRSVREFIDAQLQANPEVARRMSFEILETEGIVSYASIEAFISAVRHRGCQITIDDFGSGYSNFYQLSRLAVDHIKIDGSLIRNLPEDVHSQTIVTNVIVLARYLEIRSVTAEFVQSSEILERVRALGIDFVQGNHLAAAAPDLLPPEDQARIAARLTAPSTSRKSWPRPGEYGATPQVG